LLRRGRDETVPVLGYYAKMVIDVETGPVRIRFVATVLIGITTVFNFGPSACANGL
jgi:hypothetical protein